MLYHGTGTGKTSSAISIVNNISSFTIKSKSTRVRVLCPAALKSGWRKELDKWLYDQKMPVTFISTNSSKLVEELDSELKSVNLNETNIFIIDECHLFFSSLVSEESNKRIIYQLLLEIIHKENVFLILLSATPCVNSIYELIFTFNLLRRDCLPPQNVFNQLFLNEFADDVKNPHILCKRITGLVSYYETLEGETWPRVTKETIRIKMSEMQENSYIIAERKDMQQKSAKGLRHFTIDACNFVVKPEIMESYLSDLLDVRNIIKEATQDEVDEMSPKYKDMIDKINSSNRPCCVYFTHIDKGLIPFSYILEEKNGFKKFSDKSKSQSKTYASVYGKTSSSDRDKILAAFNSEANKYGEVIKVILITQVFSAGVTIMYLEYLLIDGEWWNSARRKQVEGRAARYNTHINLPHKDRFVSIITYCMQRDSGLTANEELTEVTQRKDLINDKYLYFLKIGSIDLDFNKKQPGFLLPKLESFKPDISFVFNPRPYNTISIYSDPDLNLNVVSSQFKKKIGRIIPIVTKNNKTPKQVILFKTDTNEYILLDKVYNTIIGYLLVDSDKVPLFYHNYFLAHLYV